MLQISGTHPLSHFHVGPRGPALGGQHCPFQRKMREGPSHDKHTNPGITDFLTLCDQIQKAPRKCSRSSNTFAASYGSTLHCHGIFSSVSCPPACISFVFRGKEHCNLGMLFRRQILPFITFGLVAFLIVMLFSHHQQGRTEALSTTLS